MSSLKNSTQISQKFSDSLTKRHIKLQKKATDFLFLTSVTFILIETYRIFTISQVTCLDIFELSLGILTTPYIIVKTFHRNVCDRRINFAFCLFLPLGIMEFLDLNDIFQYFFRAELCFSNLFYIDFYLCFP